MKKSKSTKNASENGAATAEDLETQLTVAAERFARQVNIFETTLSAITDFAYIFDREGRFVYANQSLLNLLGLTLEEITGKNFFELPYPTGLAKRLQRQIQQVFETKKRLVDETPYTSPKGIGGFYEYIFSPVFAVDGTVDVVAGSTRDITSRKRAEEKLRESEERFRLLVESATDYAIFTSAENGLIDSWNTGAEKVFGFKEREIVGKSAAILFTPEDRERGVPGLEMRTAVEKGRAEDERFHIRKDGSRFYASGVMMPLRDGKGFVKIARDMTDKINVEQAVRDREMLQKLVGAQEDERRRIARDLHDHLGQRLTALRLKLESAKEVCAESEVCRRIDEVQTIAAHLDADVDFLAWELRPAALDHLGLSAALKNYVREWSLYADIPAQLHTVGMKKTRLSNVVETNLYRIVQEALNNVHKHAKAGRVDVMLEKRGNALVLVVEDDGIGFDAEDKDKCAKGIGLVGMRERAALVGGTNEIESAPGKGTTIFVRIPV